MFAVANYGCSSNLPLKHSIPTLLLVNLGEVEDDIAIAW
jgi:hypothetical protein